MKERLLLKKYEELYGELWPGHYLSMYVSNAGNVIVKHYLEENDWTNDTKIRQVNLGKIIE